MYWYNHMRLLHEGSSVTAFFLWYNPFDSYWNYADQKDSIFYVYYNMIPQRDGNKYHTYVDKDYDGCLTIGVKNGKVATITYAYTPDDTLGSLKTVTKEKEVKLTSNQDAFDFFNYSSTRSVWEGIGVESGNTKVAKVSKTGIVTPVSTGTTFITGVITKNGIDYCITVKLDVKKPYVKFATVSTTKKNGAKQKVVAKAYGLTGSMNIKWAIH